MKTDNLHKFFSLNPFSISKKEKEKLFLNHFIKLNSHHYQNCIEYKLIIDNLKIKHLKNCKIDSFTALPINLFKYFDLISCKKKDIVKKIFSSGTSGKNLSKINLDKLNSINQVKTLKNIVESILGKERVPMLILDKDPKKDPNLKFNARAAGILGFSIFGTKHCYLLNQKNELDLENLHNFLKEYGNKKFLIFGFTSLVYEHFVSNSLLRNHKINLKNGYLFHGGGWKKLEKYKISNNKFKSALNNQFKLKNVYNYYGLVEQTGSIFIEGNGCGFLHTSIFSDIIIRDANFKLLKNNRKGIIQLLSLLPTSYPGHNILTEDIGEIIGEDDCKCGLKGKYFLVHGRIENAELRGCSDVS